ncbi:hypothetical protein [Hymenobacter persicinus]|uniref:Uncharacterized protein n=1 Tax=Hymenobacter persicinus TaxID=2025506 RepID=A0A4Q5L8W0_9BACT|nr:hypothetical protein [Hymenobacter persicinus]RYU78149.1 hypothetical protein EWM57_15005 [Hymenobacter persicinus]
METQTLQPRQTNVATRPGAMYAIQSVGAGGPIVPIQNTFFQELNKQAQDTVVKNLGINDMVPVDEGALGDFPWFWNNLGVFNLNTYQWLNNVFSYNQAGGYVQAASSELTTAYFNVVSGITYQLSAEDQASLNNAVNQNAAVANTLYNDWISFAGPIPASANATTMAAKMGYITSQVILWGATGLTLGALRSSQDPISLLPNMPLGSETVVNDLMTYLANTSAVAGIQSSVLSRNNQLANLRKNLQPAPATATQGWIQAAGANGTVLIEPGMNIAEPIGAIQNALYPTSGGASFSVTMNVSKVDQNTVHVTADGGFGGSGSIGWFGISGSASASYNMFSFSQQTENCTVTMTFNGVTKVTPTMAPYDISSSTGWWLPSVIKQAVNFDPKVGGYQFTIPTSYDFGTDGTFGIISSLIISQLPTFEMTYTSTDYSSFQEVFQEQSSWGVSFLGIPLAGGSQSYYKSTLSQNSTAGTITVTMSPPANSTPVPTLGQVAFVVGAEMQWPSA